MLKIFRPLLIAVAALALGTPAFAQTAIAKFTGPDGKAVYVSAANPLPVTGGGGGGGSGDASAANQATQITAEQAIQAVLGSQANTTQCSGDAAACTVQALIQRAVGKLTTLNTTLGSPFQAGGSIGNTGFQATGNVASGATDSGNPVKVGCEYISTITTVSTGQRVNCRADQYGDIRVKPVSAGNAAAGDGVNNGVMESQADSASQGTTTVYKPIFPFLFNGTSWDRTRAIIAGMNSSGTGIQATGIVCQLDGTSTTSVTEDNFAPCRLTASREIMVSDATLGTKIDTLSTYVDTLETLIAATNTKLDTLNTTASSTASTSIKADHTTPGDTDGFVLRAGENHAGEVGGNAITVQVAQTVTASSAYASGNAIGGLMTVANAARVSGSAGAPGTSGILQSLVINSKSAQTTQVDIFMFSANPTGSTCTDKTAFSLAAADFDKVLGVVSVPATTGWYAAGTPSVGQAQNLAIPYALASATSVYACAVTRATPTFASTSDISIGYRFLRN